MKQRDIKFNLCTDDYTDRAPDDLLEWLRDHCGGRYNLGYGEQSITIKLGIKTVSKNRFRVAKYYVPYVTFNTVSDAVLFKMVWGEHIDDKGSNG